MRGEHKTCSTTFGTPVQAILDHSRKSSKLGSQGEPGYLPVLYTDSILRLICADRILRQVEFPALGKPSFQKSAVFLNIVQKAFDPPPLLFEHLSYFAGGVF